jgi:hypothetical protein
MARQPQKLPLIRYESFDGELRPRSRIVVLEIPLGLVSRNRAIRKLSKNLGLKQMADKFGLSTAQVWRIIRGLTSGRANVGKRRGKTRR